MITVGYPLPYGRGSAGSFVIGCLLFAISAGCSLPVRAPEIAGPFAFPNEQAVPRVVVYGGLNELLPEYDPTTPLERWLYGPRDYGHTLLRNPQGLASVGETLLVCDQGHPDVVGVHLTSGRSRPWGSRGYRPRCPVDVAVDEDGRVYAADTTLHSVLVYDASMTFQEELKLPLDEGFRPCGVLAHAGVLYVGNLAGRRVDRWNIGERVWLEPLRPPQGGGVVAAPSGLAVAADGTLLITDAVLGRVQRVTPGGEWLSPIGRPGRLPGEFVRPKQVCVTASGLIFVTDAGRQSVSVFDREGEFLLEVHEHPAGWRGFTLPMGLALLPPERLPALAERLAERGLPAPQECVIVSDSLGHPPLTVLGVFTGPVALTEQVKPTEQAGE